MDSESEKKSRIVQASSLLNAPSIKSMKALSISGNISLPAAKKAKVATPVNSSAPPAAQASRVDLQIQQAKKHAVSQAQQERSTGSFRIFDSPFGNFLVPVVPTRAELAG
ncbi:uncharacterized protein LOC131157319 isoform X2 [Malania oleifera]|uniref:uncharacterized protein LOC131157319 isoform X2 n=1 Tax=Malania oleifera TaxID=397392 RepID=UPI0025AE45F2|nr:uncharacterized protein LOC131157319 isoform X2 [Malania oleifera]